eukprot:TRINITY_DN577_c0_g1_i1.p2 TRINITY_DN577_c0_g1~~TRINITY_DN577_c0_g1_i1.p2  ORF type:complete len:228 (+),score=44.91 TRINITY_DN577_c0_g1_i1:151-834(+)
MRPNAISIQIQTEELPTRHSAKAVYEKIENSTRCSLIQMLQQNNVTLREAADRLGMNYSTAKTIVQTFRREKRVAKKPKRLAATKKSIEKERFLTHFLNKFKVKALLSGIIRTELEAQKTSKHTHKLLAETSTAIASSQGYVPSIRKTLPRVESAGEMLLVGLEEEGPCAGQTSRGVSANMELTHKRPVFFVIADNNIEEEYKKKLDYSNPVPVSYTHLTLPTIYSV